jgi:hypothetical protein
MAKHIKQLERRFKFRFKHQKSSNKHELSKKQFIRHGLGIKKIS